MRHQLLGKSLAAFLAPHGVGVAIEGEVAESLVYEVVGGMHALCQVVARDVGYAVEPLHEVLRHGDDAIPGKGIHVVMGIELPYNGIGFPLLSPFHYTVDTVLHAVGSRHAAHDPRLMALGVVENATQELGGVGLGEVGEQYKVNHWHLLVATLSLCRVCGACSNRRR